MILWESQGKTSAIFITTLSRKSCAHTVCCCYNSKVLSYVMTSDKVPLPHWEFQTWFIGENERRGLVWESCHISCIFFAHTLSTEATKNWSNARNNAAVTEATFLVTKYSLQRFSPHTIQTSPDLCTAKLHIYAIHFGDLKSNLPGTAIQYFHCNCYIFLNLHASLKIKWNWNKWLCQLHNP